MVRSAVAHRKIPVGVVSHSHLLEEVEIRNRPLARVVIHSLYLVNTLVVVGETCSLDRLVVHLVDLLQIGSLGDSWCD